MNPQQQQEWKSKLLDHILMAIANSPELSAILVFKGARVLARRIATQRQSLDIDSNLVISFIKAYPGLDEKITFLKTEFEKSIGNYFAGFNPIEFELTTVKIVPNPPKAPHPLGWNAFLARLSIIEISSLSNHFPTIEIDIAYPEELLPTSVEPLKIGSVSINAYSLARIAGEKLRAFLSSLPTYNKKINRNRTTIRAKDLYDIALILRDQPISQTSFWRTVANEFEIACRSRFIDCSGLETFKESWNNTSFAYEQATIPNHITFEDAEQSLETIIRFFEELNLFPMSYPLQASQ